MGHFIDLTHTLYPEMATWDGNSSFHAHVKITREADQLFGFHVEHLELQAGIDTHLDAPFHICDDGLMVDALSIEKLWASCSVLQVPCDPSFVLKKEHVEAFEREHKIIESGCWFFVSIGWDRYWRDREKFRSNLQCPSIDEAVASHLLDRGVIGLGVDVLGPDLPTSNYPVHRRLLSQGCLILENLSSLQQLPPVGAWVAICPMKVPLAEAPVCAVAWRPLLG